MEKRISLFGQKNECSKKLKCECGDLLTMPEKSEPCKNDWMSTSGKEKKKCKNHLTQVKNNKK